MNEVLKLALEYLEKHNFSIFPANPAVNKEKGAKAPLITSVTPYRERLPTREEVLFWWTKWPNALIACHCGELSNILVLDADTKEAIEKIEEFIPETYETPVVVTPNGGRHYYFQYREGLSNDSRGIIHVRTQGAYIILPGSRRADGAVYRFLNGSTVKNLKNEIREIPDDLFNYLLSFNSFHQKSNGPSPPSNRIPLFEYGHRDIGLFHTALHLLKAGMPDYEVDEVLEAIMKSWGEGELKKWRWNKIESAKKHLQTKERNLTAEAREFILSNTGSFTSSDVYRFLNIHSRNDKKAISTALNRFWKTEGIIEPEGKKHGSWRVVNKTIEEQCWWEHKGQPLDLKFPLGLEEFVRIYPGNIILLEGQKSQGKSSFALEFCRFNRKLYKTKIIYQNVEMSDDELIERFETYGNVMTPDEWRESVMFIKQTGDWWDVIDPDGLNIIDYLIEYKEAYMIPDFIFRIHKRLKTGIALVIVQRDPLKPYPVGGRGVRDIPRLVLSLIKHRLKIEDCKSFKKTSYGNPTGLSRKYKQVNWWDFRPASPWEMEKEERYRDFVRND